MGLSNALDFIIVAICATSMEVLKQFFYKKE
jgi:hypothetical protein